MHRFFAIVATAVVASTACCVRKDNSLTTPPLPPYENSDSECYAACGNLRRLGCPEGFGAISGETCERRCVIAQDLRPLPLACWSKAETPVAAKSCGSLRCLHQ